MTLRVTGPSAPDQPSPLPGPVLDFAWNQRWLQQLQRHAKVIKFQAYGHLHDDTLRLVPSAGKNSSARQRVVVHLSASHSCLLFYRIWGERGGRKGMAVWCRAL